MSAMAIEARIGELSLAEPQVRSTGRVEGTLKGGCSTPTGKPPKYKRLGLKHWQIEHLRGQAEVLNRIIK